MENALFFLERVIATWQNTTPPWVTDTIIAIVCGVVLFLVLRPWLDSAPSLPPPRKHGHIRKRPVELKCTSSFKKKGGALKACRGCLQDLDEVRGLITLLGSHLGRRPDLSGFRQLSCQDPPGKVCRAAHKGANHCYREPVRDAAPATSPSASPAPLSEWELPLASTLSPASSQCESQQEHASHHPPEASLQDDPTERQTEPNTLSLLSSDEQNLLEIQVTKKTNVNILKESEKDALYREHMNPNYHLNSLGNMWKSLGAEQDTTIPQPFRSTRDKQEQLPSPQQLYNQLFWGLPSLHSESLVATTSIPENSSALQSLSFSFNRFLNACPTQLPAKISPLLSHSQPKSHLEVQPQPLFPSMLQFQPKSVAQAQTRGRLQTSSPALPPSYPPKIRAFGVCCPIAQNKPQPWIPRKIRHPERPLLQKQLESRWDSSSAVRSQEVFSAFTSNCPKNSILPENFLISHERQEHHLQKWPIRHGWQLSPKIQEPWALRQHQSELPGTCQAKGKHGSSQPSSFTAKRSKDAQKMGSLLSQDPGKVPEYLPRGLESSLGVLQRAGSGESESDLVLSRNDSGSELPRNLDRNLENIQKDRADSRLGHRSRNLTPVTGYRSWLAVGHSLARVDTPMETRNLGTVEGGEPYVNTCQRVSFLPRDSQRALEAHLTKFSVQHRWGLPLRVLKATNLFKVKKAAASPGLRLTSAFPSTYTSGAHSVGKSEESPEKPPLACPGEKVNAEESVPTLARPLLARSPVCEDMQSALGGTPSGDDHGSSTASLTRREGRPPSQSLVLTRQSRTVEWVERGRLGPGPSSAMTRNEPTEKRWGGASQDPHSRVTVLDVNLGSQSLRAKEARGTVEASWSPALQPELGTHVLAKSEDVNAPLRSLEAAGTSGSSLFPGTSVPHSPGKACLNNDVFNELRSKGKVQFKDQPQNCPMHMPLAADHLASQVPQGHSQRVPTGHGLASHVLHGLTASRRSSLEKQEPSISNGQDSWKNQIKMMAHFYKGEGCRRPNPGEHAEGPEELGTSQATGMSPYAKAEGTGNAVGPEKYQGPPESVFRQRMRLFCRWISPHKELSGEEALKKYKSTSASAQSQGPGRCRSVMESKIPEAQTVMAAVGQILEERIAVHHGLHSTKLNEQELEVPVYGCCRYHRLPFYPEKGSTVSHSACSHQANPPTQSCASRDRQVKHTESLTSVKANDELSGQSCLPPLPRKKTMSSVRPWQYGPKMPGTPGHHQHCPRHCLSRRGALPGYL